MKEFEVELDISREFVKNKVLIETADETFGQEVYTYLHHFNHQKLLAVKDGDTYHFLEAEEIIYLEVYDKELTIKTKKATLTTRLPLKEMKEKLNPTVFVQVSKSLLLNIKELQKLEVAFSGNYYAFLSNGEKVTVSRRFIKELKEILAI